MTELLFIGGIVYFLIVCYVAEQFMDHDMPMFGAFVFGALWPLIVIRAAYVELGNAMHIARENKKYTALRRAEEEDLI